MRLDVRRIAGLIAALPLIPSCLLAAPPSDKVSRMADVIATTVPEGPLDAMRQCGYRSVSAGKEWNAVVSLDFDRPAAETLRISCPQKNALFALGERAVVTGALRERNFEIFQGKIVDLKIAAAIRSAGGDPAKIVDDGLISYYELAAAMRLALTRIDSRVASAAREQDRIRRASQGALILETLRPQLDRLSRQ
ncbi:MAG: hypothetical protein HY078_10085 [Elusimicrobia bacterium]|nr:hypothetical protein [Elusimicrobiota bacterium]